MDYHPQNVIVRGMRVTGVIDWVSADRGDRHLCAATTAVILASSAMDHPRWMRDNAAGNSLRALFTALYIPLYHALAPMELGALPLLPGGGGTATPFDVRDDARARRRRPPASAPRRSRTSLPAVVRLLSRYTERKAGLPVSIQTVSA